MNMMEKAHLPEDINALNWKNQYDLLNKITICKFYIFYSCAFCFDMPANVLIIVCRVFETRNHGIFIENFDLTVKKRRQFWLVFYECLDA